MIAIILFTGSVFFPVYENKLVLKHWLTRTQEIGGVVPIVFLSLYFVKIFHS